MTCPSCKGAKGGHGFVCGAKGGDVRWLPCSVCGGSGEVTEERAVRIQEGTAFRLDRAVSRGKTLREEAARLGVDMVELSAIEQGHDPRTEAGRLALEQRRAEMK